MCLPIMYIIYNEVKTKSIDSSKHLPDMIQMTDTFILHNQRVHDQSFPWGSQQVFIST